MWASSRSVAGVGVSLTVPTTLDAGPISGHGHRMIVIDEFVIEGDRAVAECAGVGHEPVRRSMCMCCR